MCDFYLNYNNLFLGNFDQQILKKYSYVLQEII